MQLKWRSVLEEFSILQRKAPKGLGAWHIRLDLVCKACSYTLGGSRGHAWDMQICEVCGGVPSILEELSDCFSLQDTNWETPMQ